MVCFCNPNPNPNPVPCVEIVLTVHFLPVIETMLRSLLMVCGLMSLNQSSLTSSLVRSKDICLVIVLCIWRRRYVSLREHKQITSSQGFCLN